MKKNPLVGNNKTKIDIESEFVGLSVGQKTKKPKKNDLTKDFKLFIDSPKDIDSIKNIFGRIEGRYLSECPGTLNMKIYGLMILDSDIDAFLINIKHLKYFKIVYYLTRNNLYKLSRCNCESLSTSPLKRDVSYSIWKFLIENPQYTKNF